MTNLDGVTGDSRKRLEHEHEKVVVPAPFNIAAECKLVGCQIRDVHTHVPVQHQGAILAIYPGVDPT